MLRTVTRLRVSLQSIQRTLSSISPPLSQISPPLPTRTHTKRADPYPLTSILSHPYSSRRRKNNEEHGEDDGDGLFVINRDPKSPPKLFVLQPRLRPDTLLQSKLSEALNLANSLEEQRDEFCVEEFGEKEPPPHLVVQNPVARSLRALADTYFGPGTVESIKCHLNSLDEEDGIDAVFVNAILSGIQQRNLERAWGKPVLDRVGLIIEIFNAHAQTKEAKLQSELAALMYKRTRLVRFRGPGGRLAFGTSGEAEVVSARGRGSGGRGFISGAGETELQLQRRSIQERRSRLLSQIEEVRRTRALQRAARKRHGGSQDQGLATVAVVGYTNAGKSTLVSALSQCDLYSDNRLFATVDPLLRSVNLPSGRKALLSDTVGFISDLPVQLVEAFHATLEEVIEADLLVHVLDSSAENLDEQRSTVLQVLQQIGVSEEKIQNMIEVWNKIDILDGVSGAYAHDDGDLEESEDVGGSFTEEDITTELSSPENIDEDDLEMEADEALDKGEDLLEDEAKSGARLGEKEDALEAFSPGEHTDEDVLASISSPPEKLETADGQKDEFLKDWKMTVEPTQHQSNDVQHMRTSALTGVGLQELLNLIDEKLSAQKPLEKRGSEYFNRKWRPSYATDDGRVAEK